MRSFLSSFSLFVLLAPMAVFFFPENARAAASTSTINDLRSQISDHNSSISDLEKEIAQYQAQLDTLGQQSDSLQNAIATLNTNEKKISTSIELAQNKIAAAKLTIEQLQNEMQQQQLHIEQNKDLIAESIRELNQQDANSLVEVLLKNDNISEFWDNIDDLSHFQEGLQAGIQTLRTLQSSNQQKQVLAQSQQQQLLGYQSDLNGQKELLQNTKGQKSLLLKETQNKESQYQDLVQQKQERKKQFQAELDDLESKLKVALDPSKLPAAGTTPLSWPVIGPITQRFGRTVAAQRLYVSGSHSGLDIGVPVGTPVKAAADGIVEGVGNTDLACPGASYGKFVFIRYDNGLASIEGHLSVIQVTQGQHVSRGQVVGLSGATGYVTGPHLHFGVYAAQAVQMASFQSAGCPGATYYMPVAPHNAYLPPLQYLPPDPYY
ncbi:MAG TPA: peptidoglycan DD-metalloendopeptidase family protein [Candidatus Paceibacterota bacterium]|nr:peptidoglycan DD-metalloendopeptidase family protein [Candidatus Paceibacterota bacterium]